MRIHVGRRLGAVALAVFLLVGAAVVATRSGGATVSHAGSMLAARDQHTATLLSDGRVLITGGRSGDVDSPSLASAELYDPKADTFTAAGSITTARSYQSATLLVDGRVLIAGGVDSSNPPNDLASAELYDPKIGTFRPTGLMSKPRAGQTATLLKDGRVLIVDDLGTSADLYDPKTGKFAPTGSMSTFRTACTATLLSDGRVLIAGGYDDSFNPLRSAELYDPATGTFGKTGSMATARQYHTATVLPDGRVLVAGGSVGFSDTLTSAELFDPVGGTFSSTGPMATARSIHTATLLADGRVLIAGGLGARVGENKPILASAELYDPKTGTFSPIGAMVVARYEDAATLLADGRVLVTGGSTNKTGTLASAELYDPKTGAFGPAS